MHELRMKYWAQKAEVCLLKRYKQSWPHFVHHVEVHALTCQLKSMVILYAHADIHKLVYIIISSIVKKQRSSQVIIVRMVSMIPVSVFLSFLGYPYGGSNSAC